MPYPSSSTLPSSGLLPGTTGTPPEDPPAVTDAVGIAAPESRLALSITASDGSIYRWGFDEPDTARILNDLTFTTTVPGGFSAMTCGLLRDIIPRRDEGLYNTVKVYGPGGQVAWEGRIAQLPRGNGTLTPGAVGWSAHLEDDQSFREVYVDRDIGSWGEAPLYRRAEFFYPYGVDYTTSGLTFSGVTGKSIPLGSGVEAWYSMPPGLTARALHYQGTAVNSTTNVGFTYYGSTATAVTSPVSMPLTLDGMIHSDTLSVGRRYLFLQAQASATHTPTNPYTVTFQKIAVYGNHGLTLRTVTGDLPGIYASDAIANVVGRAAPLLTFTTGASGSIQPTTFPIPHLSFPEPTTAADVIARANAYHGGDWAVWDDKTFHFGPAASGVQWQARKADGAELSLEGDAADQIYNGIVVSYTDTGVTKYAGPIGSGLDIEHASLQDDSVDNPVNANGIPRRWFPLPITTPTTDAGAVELGALRLAELNSASRRGQITLKGTIRHPTEGQVPVWRVRAGDTLIVTDLPGGAIRRIISTSYNHAARTLTCELDNTAHTMDAILSRVVANSGGLT